LKYNFSKAVERTL